MFTKKYMSMYVWAFVDGPVSRILITMKVIVSDYRICMNDAVTEYCLVWLYIFMGWKTR